MFARFLFFHALLPCVCFSDSPPSMCLSPLHLPFLDLPLCLCVCFFGPPTQNTRFNSEGWCFFPFFFFFFVVFFRLITLGIFPAFEHSFLGSDGSGRDDSDSSISPTVHAGESHANYPGYWLPRRRGCDLHEVTFSSNIQTFAPLFFFSSGKQLTVLNSLL